MNILDSTRSKYRKIADTFRDLFNFSFNFLIFYIIYNVITILLRNISSINMYKGLIFIIVFSFIMSVIFYFLALRDEKLKRQDWFLKNIENKEK